MWVKHCRFFTHMGRRNFTPSWSEEAEMHDQRSDLPVRAITAISTDYRLARTGAYPSLGKVGSLPSCCAHQR